MKKQLYLVPILFLFSCGVKKQVVSKKNIKIQKEEVLKEEQIKKIKNLNKYYSNEIASLKLFDINKINQNDFFERLKKNVAIKKGIKDKPYEKYKEELESNINFLFTVKPYFYLQEDQIQQEIKDLIFYLTALQKLLIIIPELSYEKRSK